MILLTQVAVGAKTISSYYVKTFENGSIDESLNCEQTNVDDDEVIYEYECGLGDEASYYGYGLTYLTGDHAMVPKVSYIGEEISYEDFYKLHDPNSGASHFYGPDNGVIEVRYYVEPNAYEMKRVPFALILRMDTARPSMDTDGNITFKGSDQELLVIHLSGKNTKVVGKVNGRQKNANQKARRLADSLLK